MGATAGLVLAAGEGRRFGGPKAPYELDGVRLVDRAVAVLREAGCDPVVVVLGAWLGEVPGAQVVRNDDWATGMGSSLRVGLDAVARHDGVERVAVTLVDLPGLTAEAVRRALAGAAGTADGAPARALAVATYDGRRGHPVVLGRAHWAGAAASAAGDRGARDYLATHAPVLVEVGDVASDDDLDERP
ncbi:MAG: NTP transferase domain-containing protein [Frankiales bacterium]|nr:NTP transferase domain-containing protein [Frankiales bacterium]